MIFNNKNITIGNTGVIVALPVVDWTLAGRTVELVLSTGTVRYLVASSIVGNTKHVSCRRGRALELVLQTLVVLTVALITGVPALVPAVADLSRMGAVLVLALELARGADKGRTVVGLVQAVSTVVLRVAPPPEWNTFVGVGAQELAPAAVGLTGDPVLGQNEILRAAAH